MKVKNKNGFVASSLMFSFFLVFILLSVLVLTSYTHYLAMIKNLNGTILDGLNDHIASKYSGIKTLVKNGKIAGVDNWTLNDGARYVNNTNNNSEFMQILPNTSGTFSQSINNVSSSRVLYVAFNFNTWYPDDCTTCTFSVEFNGNKIDNFYYLDNNNLTRLESDKLVNNTVNNKLQKWILFGGIYRTQDNVNEISFKANDLNYSVDNAGGVFGINNIVLVDITNLYKNNNASNDEMMIEYLLKRLPYIEYDQKYSLPKV